MWVLMFGMVGLGGRESGAYGILASEAIQSFSLALQSIDDIHGRDCLPLGMLCVGHSITDDILQENLNVTNHHSVHMHSISPSGHP